MGKMKENEVRDKLIRVMDQYGMPLTFIARALKWDYFHLNRFKNGHLDHLKPSRERILEQFLDKYDKKIV